MPNEFTINFDDIPAKRAFMARIGAAVGKWTFTARKASRRRSLKANARYWAAVVPAFQRFMHQHGQVFEKEEVHEFFLQQFAGREVVDPVSDEVLTVVGKRSSKMDVGEFAKFTNAAEEWMLDRFGVIVPEPEVMEAAQ